MNRRSNVLCVALRAWKCERALKIEIQDEYRCVDTDCIIMKGIARGRPGLDRHGHGFDEYLVNCNSLHGSRQEGP